MMNNNIQRGLTRAFKNWLLHSHDVDANELDEQQVRLYLDFYEQQQYESRTPVLQGSLRDSW